MKKSELVKLIKEELLKESSKDEIKSVLDNWNVKFYTINEDLTVDVDGSVTIVARGIKKIPVSFGHVKGHFICGNNHLTSLDGCPKEVGGDFDCSNNKLTSLKGAPEKVGGSYGCAGNELTSLGGCPKKIDGDLDCSSNKLTSLKGAPDVVKRNFDCTRNDLKTLEGGPTIVGGSFDCSYNKLTSLKGAPEKVKFLYCSGNSLTSLEGFPKSVKGEFSTIPSNPKINISKKIQADTPLLKLLRKTSPQYFYPEE